MLDPQLTTRRPVTGAVYSRAHLVDHMRTLARRHLNSARYWRLEAEAAYSHITAPTCRACARQ